jgi:glycosyltransferase involved in cell wall biosynthesis
MERELLARSHLVFTTARGLYDAKREYARSLYLLPNAADVGNFALADREETPVPGKIDGLPHPLLGFVGVIHDWIDLGLIEFIARARPQWTVAMIGPVGPGIQVDRLAALPNVRFFGRKSKEELPGYMKAFDVCLNPFRKNVLTDRVSPLKVYEYLASGRPVVSVDMPGVREFKDIIEIAGDYDGFLSAVEKVLQSDSPEKKKARLKVAARHSWESRAAFISEKIVEMLNCNTSGQETAK